MYVENRYLFAFAFFVFFFSCFFLFCFAYIPDLTSL